MRGWTSSVGVSSFGVVSSPVQLSSPGAGDHASRSGYLPHKRALDLVLVMALGLPILAALVILFTAVRLIDGTPPLFAQRRVGLNGRCFMLYKIRTMRLDEERGKDTVAANMTLPDDGRITRVGRFLRRWRLDELPQIINIARGEMSWIGPRPDASVLATHYEHCVPGYRARYAVRPGLSGWAQVNQGHVVGCDQVRTKLDHDLHYIGNASAWLDLLIAIRTIGVIVTGRGAR